MNRMVYIQFLDSTVGTATDAEDPILPGLFAVTIPDRSHVTQAQSDSHETPKSVDVRTISILPIVI